MKHRASIEHSAGDSSIADDLFSVASDGADSVTTVVRCSSSSKIAGAGKVASSASSSGHDGSDILTVSEKEARVKPVSYWMKTLTFHRVLHKNEAVGKQLLFARECVTRNGNKYPTEVFWCLCRLSFLLYISCSSRVSLVLFLSSQFLFLPLSLSPLPSPTSRSLPLFTKAAHLDEHITRLTIASSLLSGLRSVKLTQEGYIGCINMAEKLVRWEVDIGSQVMQSLLAMALQLNTNALMTCDQTDAAQHVEDVTKRLNSFVPVLHEDSLLKILHFSEPEQNQETYKICYLTTQKKTTSQCKTAHEILFLGQIQIQIRIKVQSSNSNSN